VSEGRIEKSKSQTKTNIYEEEEGKMTVDGKSIRSMHIKEGGCCSNSLFS